MAYFGNIGTNNQGMINQLMRQKENIENMITQYSQPPAPVQTIINTGSNNFEFEARILKDDEDISNIAIMRKTLFVDEKNKKILIKEVDGSISKEYEIIVPLDEKDKKILELENRLKEMEEKVNDKYAKSTKSNDVKQQSNANDNGNVKSTAKTISK